MFTITRASDEIFSPEDMDFDFWGGAQAQFDDCVDEFFGGDVQEAFQWLFYTIDDFCCDTHMISETALNDFVLFDMYSLLEEERMEEDAA